MRCLLDSRSEHSYITQRAISQLNLRYIGKQTLIHGLFWGSESSPKQHSKYKLKTKSLKVIFFYRLDVLLEEKICSILPKITDNFLISEPEKKNIYVPDVGSPVSDIDLLLGADSLGFIYTEKLIKLECGFTVVETYLGFALMGKDTKINKAKSLLAINQQQNPRSVMNMSSNQILSLDVKELWSLETIVYSDALLTTIKTSTL